MSTVYAMELSTDRINSLTSPEVKKGLTQYVLALGDIKNKRWEAAEGLKRAYEHQSEEGEKFEKKGAFYAFVGLKDSNGSQLVNAVKYNESIDIDGASLKDYGFTVGKVYTLSSMVEDKIVDFIEYALTVTKTDIRGLANLSDKGLIAMVKAWKESLNPTKTETQQEAKTETQQEAKTETQQEAKTETQQEAKTETQQEAEAETQQEAEAETLTVDLNDIHREDIFKLVALYTGGDKFNVTDFLKSIMKEYGIKQIRG